MSYENGCYILWYTFKTIIWIDIHFYISYLRIPNHQIQLEVSGNVNYFSFSIFTEEIKFVVVCCTFPELKIYNL